MNSKDSEALKYCSWSRGLELPRKAKVGSAPGKDDRARLIENSREHKETEIRQRVLTWYHFATLELDTFLPEKAVRAAID